MPTQAWGTRVSGDYASPSLPLLMESSHQAENGLKMAFEGSPPSTVPLVFAQYPGGGGLAVSWYQAHIRHLSRGDRTGMSSVWLQNIYIYVNSLTVFPPRVGGASTSLSLDSDSPY